MTNELLIINPSEFSLTIDRIEEIKKPFYPLADEYTAFIPGIEKIKEESKNWITLELVNRAKKAKQDIAKTRNKVKNVKDEEKKGVLQVWNAIQKCHNLIVWVIEEQELELEKIVKFFENLEKERIDNLQKERVILLTPFIAEVSDLVNLWEMEENMFKSYLLWKQTAFKDKKELEEKLEKEKQELEEKRKADELIIIKENARLEAEAKVMREKIESEMRQKADLERVEKEKQEEIQKIKQEQIDKENDKIKRQKDIEKAELENQEQAEFVKFLKVNWYTSETKEDFYIKHWDNWIVILYKKIAELWN